MSLRNAFVVVSVLFSLNTGWATVRTNSPASHAQVGGGPVIRSPRMQSGRIRMSALPAFSAGLAAAEEKEKKESPSPVFELPASARTRQAAISSALAAPAASFNGLSSPAPSVTFQAQPMIGNYPPDTTGAAGPNHVVSASNDQLVVQDRAGHSLHSTSLTAFWSAAFADINPAWDPGVRYDPYADRWIVVSMGNYGVPGSSMLLAVSATGDPTGTWYLRRILSDSNDTSFDHPRIGFNKNWIVVTGNQVANTSGNPWIYSLVYAFDKADRYAGGAKPPVEWSNITSDFTLNPALTYDPNVGTMYLMANFNGNSSGAGSLSLSTITGTVGSESLNLNVAFPSTSNTWASTVPQNFAPQLGDTEKIGVFDARLNTVVYRNGSLWTTHTVFVPASAPTISAVDWWQVDTNGSVQQFGRLQDPGGLFFYTYPSLSVNAKGDMLVGYSRMASTEYASAAYALRAASDPAGTLRSEFLMQPGQGPYVKKDTFGINRWGDYSATQVDPVNDLDFWTIQEYAGPHNSFSTWAMWWANVAAPQLQTGPPVTMTASATELSVFAGGSSGVTLNVASNTYTGAVSFQVVSNSPAITGDAPTVALTPGANGSSTLTIHASPIASSRAPALPWTRGEMMVFAVLLGGCVGLRRIAPASRPNAYCESHKPLLALVAIALAISAAGLAIACAEHLPKLVDDATLTVTPQLNPPANPAPSAVTITVHRLRP